MAGKCLQELDPLDSAVHECVSEHCDYPEYSCTIVDKRASEVGTFEIEASNNECLEDIWPSDAYDYANIVTDGSDVALRTRRVDRQDLDSLTGKHGTFFKFENGKVFGDCQINDETGII